MNKSNIIDSLRRSEQTPNALDIITDILQVYNCRAAEVLEAEWNNFDCSQFLILNGKKNSCQIIIRDRIILERISRLPKIDSVRIFPSVTYNRLYTHIRSKFNGLISQIKHNKNLKVTHAFRYKKIKNITNANSVRELLHHRSLRSSKYYQNKTKG